MENNNNNVGLQTPQDAQSQGRWVPVDASTVGNIPSDISANQTFQGEDGATYYLGESKPTLNHIGSNMNNAVPVPSSIVQMPPIVQPIALVPYTSQNQPLLQYDPYSRPVEPQVQPAQPEYKLNPYKGHSIAAVFIGLISLIAVLFLSAACFAGDAATAAYSSSGLDMLFALLAALGLGVSSDYFTNNIVPNYDAMNSDIISAIVIYAIPICVTLIMLLTICLIIKNIARWAKGVSPKCFSVAAFINIVLILAVLALLAGISNGSNTDASIGENLLAFLQRASSAYWGIGLLVALIANIAHLIVVALPKKNNYIEITK